MSRSDIIKSCPLYRCVAGAFHRHSGWPGGDCGGFDRGGGQRDAHRVHPVRGGRPHELVRLQRVYEGALRYRHQRFVCY